MSTENSKLHKSRTKNRPDIKILELTTSFLKTSIFILKKAKAINQLNAQNDVITPFQNGAPKNEEVQGVTVHRFKYFVHNRFQVLTGRSGIPENLRNSMLAKIQVPFLIFAIFIQALRFGKHYDIIHANWSFAGLGGLLAARLLRKPFVLTMHGAEVFKLGYHPVINFLLQRVDNLIVNSTYTKKALENNYDLSELDTIKIIHFGVEYDNQTEDFSDRKFFTNKLGIPEDSRVIFNLGRMIERKGHIYLVKAFSELSKKYPDLYLVMGGSGPQREKIERIIQEERIPRIIIVDFIPEDDLPYYFANAEMFVLPAIVDADGDTEGLGVVNIEALYYGTPVISTDVGGIPDIIKNGETGLLVKEKNKQELADAIETLLGDKGFKNHLKLRGHKFVTNHLSWDNLAEQYFEYYNNLMGK